MSTMQERLAQTSALAVTVNQRSLIEKILARYAGDFTSYREALQNADDAGASSVEIMLGNREKSVDLSRLMAQVEIRNDGAAFTPSDWKRLTTIAEGNPDEGKIGNFGVGFYSNFALSDNPAVKSGDSFMQFFFKGDQLFIKVLHDLAPTLDTENSARSSSTSTESNIATSSSGNSWTSIILKLREPTPIPELESFGRFIATSLGFTKNLRNISVLVNGHVVLRLSKTVAPPKSLGSLSSVGLPAVSPRKYLRLETMEETPFQIRAEVAAIIGFRKPSLSTISTPAAASTSFAARMLSGFLSSKSSTPPPPSPTSTPPPIVEQPLTLRSTTLFLRTIQAIIKVTPTPHFASELFRATKKPLPQVTQVAIIFTSKDEADASEVGEGVGKIFSGLRSDASGRIFIGFSTFQTTGFAGAIAARFVPTVERESLDLQSTYVAEWNRELLWAAGLVSRHVYELEMKDIARLWNSNGDDHRKLEERFLHLIRFFTFFASTPSSVVGQDVQSAFFTTSTKGLHLLSSTGVLPSTSIRLSNPQLAGFYRGAVVPSRIVEGASGIIAELTQRSLLADVSLDDVLKDLTNHTLSGDEAIACFQWWIELAGNRSYNRGLLTRLQNAAILTIDDGYAPLASFQTFLNPKLIPLDLPLPSHSLPFAISKALPTNQLESTFELAQLSLAVWVQFLVSAKKIGAGTDANPELLDKILSTIARGWSGLSARDQQVVITSLQIPCIPTSKGIQLPTDSYFSNVVIFDDLPIVSLPTNAKGMDQFLQALGVRRSVELQLVFSRMLGTGNWSTVDLVVYLASVEKTLQSNELERLRKTNFLSQASTGAAVVRCRPDQLYEPTPTLRELGGLPLLAWTGNWRSTSNEAKFLFKLGLLRSPPIDTLLKLASTPDTHQNALDYFLSEYQTSGYNISYKPSVHSFAFIPAVKNGKSMLASPQEVFSEDGPRLLSLATLDPRYRNDAAKFKIMAHPPASMLVSALLSAPSRDPLVANSTFAYLSTQLSNFSNDDLRRLRSERIVPIRSSSAIVLTRANACFFSLVDSSIPSGLHSLFTTVPIEFDIASKPFLIAIGVRESPNIVDVAEMLVEDPDRMYGLAGTTEKYLQLLRSIALNIDRISTSVQGRMRAAKWLVGSRRISPVKSSNLLADSDEEDEESLLTFKLASPAELLIIDDPSSAMIFADSILACPQEDALEKLAEYLGAQRISRLISERCSVGGEPSESKRTVELRRVVEERTLLFLTEREASSSREDLVHSSDWIKTHFVVREVHSLERVVSLTVGGTTKRHSATTSASAQLDSKGAILLLVATSQELDYFDLAVGLCRLLLKKQRTHDPLLLMTILSTSLKNLKRRGFNVDRILNIRKAEQILVEQKNREQQVQDQLDLANALSSEKLAQHLAKLEMMFPDASPDHLISLLQSEKKDHLERATEALLAGTYPRRPNRSQPARSQSSSNTTSASPTTSGNTGSVFSSFKRKLLNNPSSSSSRPLPELNPVSTSALRPPTVPSTSQLGISTSAGTPSSTADVRSNILKAVQASRPSSNTVQNALSKTQIKEAEGTYCDSSASANLKFLAELDGMRFFIDAGVQDRDSFLTDNSEAIMRMIGRVVKPVAGVFRLNPNVVHIFHDESGPLIAFNRNGSLFLNFRYYKSLHDEQVKAKNLTEPLISCFHTLAHELAHNLVSPHNSEFSYYFSAICEEHFVRMSALLGQFQSPSSL